MNKTIEQKSDKYRLTLGLEFGIVDFLSREKLQSGNFGIPNINWILQACKENVCEIFGIPFPRKRGQYSTRQLPNQSQVPKSERLQTACRVAPSCWNFDPAAGQMQVVIGGDLSYLPARDDGD
jgi:hypothetical protein